MTKYVTGFIAIVFFCMQFACTENPSATASSDTPMVTPNGGMPSPDLDKITKLIAKEPQNADLYAARAEAYHQIEGYDEAIADLMKAIEIDSMQAPYYHLLADVFLDYQKSRLALNTMNRAASLFPKRIPTFLKLSEYQLILEKKEESIITLNKILKIDPQNAEAFFMLGLNFKEMGDTTRAINSFQTCVENDPELIDGWIELGYLYDRLGKPIATRYFDNALRIDPNNILALEAKGNHLANQGKFQEAIDTYQKITQLDPQYANAFFNIGLTYLDMDSIPLAQKNFNITINLDIVHVLGYFYRAKTAELQGNKEQAKEDYTQALKLNPNFDRAKEALAALQ